MLLCKEIPIYSTTPVNNHLTWATTPLLWPLELGTENFFSIKHLTWAATPLFRFTAAILLVLGEFTPHKRPGCHCDPVKIWVILAKN